MTILIKQAKIVDPNSKWNGKTADILIENGIISEINEKITQDTDQVIEHKNLHLSPGWFDMKANFKEPGEEYKEDLNSGIKSAIAGGFTGIAMMPSTTPPVSTRTAVDFIINKTKHLPVDVFPCGSISENHEGKQLAEMYDMKEAGAVAFTDNKQPIQQTGLMSKALLYTKNFNGLIMSFPFDRTAQLNGQMNEGVTSTLLGLEGIPEIAEELQVVRDLYLTEYTDSKIHFTSISSSRSVELIAQAKEDGINVTWDVAIHNLALTEELVESFDSNFKVLPPLKTEETRNELIEGLVDGTIDVICSDHTPEDVEHKNLEFGSAAFGIIGLETLFGIACTHLLDKLTLDELILKIAINPRTILQLDVPMVQEGMEANLTCFDPDLEWTYEVKDIKSKSKNSPFIGAELTGKALGIINKGVYATS